MRLSSVNSAIFSKAEGAQVLASSSEDRTVNIWDIRSANSPIAEIGSSSIVNRLSFSPSGKLLAAPRDDGLVHVFNIEGDVVAVLNPSDTSKMMSTSACWSSDERFVFSSHWDRNVYAWEFHYQSSR